MKKIILIIICLLFCICTGCSTFSTETFPTEYIDSYIAEAN